ncbi:MAG TPA: GYD domain-containing protein [Candidatus Acidoferrales bacterium]|jgi:uncharacterized protein with GYD domain|nr:GYD domain-containing protein [Candidatus Acidoferrales bacterium]
MAEYLVQVGYTAEAWAAMIREPQNRLELVAPAAESLGGKFKEAWISFGEYDLVGIIEMPDNVAAAAFSIGVTSKGAVRALKTTPLLSMDQSVEAMGRAQRLAYTPPTKSPAAVS